MKRFYLSAMASALLLFFGQNAFAASYSFGTEASIYAGVATTSPAMDYESNSAGSSSASGGVYDGANSVSANAISFADFGTNSASTDATGSTFSSAGAYASSSWVDEFIISGGSGVGTALFGFSLDGTLSATGQSGSGYTFVVEYDPADVTSIGTQPVVSIWDATSGGTITVDYTASGSGLLWGSFDFTYGESFFFNSYLNTSSWAGNYGGAGASYADFYSTAELSEIELPQGASLTSTSGTDYTGSQSTVPEPSTLLLLGAGIGGFAFIRRRLKR